MDELPINSLKAGSTIWRSPYWAGAKTKNAPIGSVTERLGEGRHPLIAPSAQTSTSIYLVFVY
jgi:hypothetical protein